MEVRNCKQCGRLFNYLGGTPLCPACKDALEDKFMQTKEYVRDNPGATIQMVSEENDVTIPQIRQWIREERLEFSKDSPVGIECEACGASIRTGRYCDACKTRMQNDFSKAYSKPQAATPTPQKKSQHDRDKMRFI